MASGLGKNFDACQGEYDNRLPDEYWEEGEDESGESEEG